MKLGYKEVKIRVNKECNWLWRFILINGKVNVSKGELFWSGEHWVNMLKSDEKKDSNAIVSHFSFRYSPAGEGNIAVIRIEGDPQIHAVCTDNKEIAKFAIPTFFEGRVDYYSSELPVIDAAFTRFGDTSKSPGWKIKTDEHLIVTRWEVTKPPVIASGVFREGMDTFTILFFTKEASIELDDKIINGKPFLRDIWWPSIGGDRSSSVFAIAESIVMKPVKDI